jgi:murein DD-endopeptidase MepM/ murein hydrolase activator NlpD
MIDSALSTREVLGLTSEAPSQAWLAIKGDPHVPGSKFGPSSLRVFTPRLAVSTWAGRRMLGRRVPVVNLVNHTPTPVEQGWSVRVTQVRDFRGRALTYDSHNGTDFAVPPGTRVVASAPGRVVAIRNEFNRGGLKVYIDHGDGLLTSYHHLARSLVDLGQDVRRGELIALSGYSGLDAFASFPWVAPHVHYNVMLGGALVDPFARAGEVSLWRAGNDARTASEDAHDEALSPTSFDDNAVNALLATLKDNDRRATLDRVRDPLLRGWALAIEAAIYPTRFPSANAGARLFGSTARRAVLDLPFDRADFDGIAFADDVGLR